MHGIRRLTSQSIGFIRGNTWNFFQNFSSILFSWDHVSSKKNAIQALKNVGKHLILRALRCGFPRMIIWTIGLTVRGRRRIPSIWHFFCRIAYQILCRVGLHTTWSCMPMSIQPDDDRIRKFCDYILDDYISPDAQFPPLIWAQYSLSLDRIMNSCESFTQNLTVCCTAHTPIPSLSLIHIWRCRRSTLCRSRWSPYH